MSALFSRIYNSPVIGAWFHQGAKIIGSVLAIKIAFVHLSTEELNVWLLFLAIVSIGQAALFGFSGTFMRFVAYSYGGVPLSDVAKLKKKFDRLEGTDFNKKELAQITNVMNFVYLILTSIFFLILAVGGGFAVRIPIGHIANQEAAWNAFGVVVGCSSLILYLSRFQVFLEGLNRVSLVQKTLGMSHTIGIGVIIWLSFYKIDLFTIVVVYQSINLASFLVIAIMGKLAQRKLLKGIYVSFFDKRVFLLVWASAWKSGLTQIVSSIIRHCSNLLVAQLFAPGASAAFQLIKKVFDLLEQFAGQTMLARVPTIARLRGLRDFEQLVPALKKTSWLVYGVFIVGYVGVLLLGEPLIRALGQELSLKDTPLLILFSFAILIARFGGINVAISNQANNVFEHIVAITGCVAYFVTILLGYKYFSLRVFPLATIMFWLSVMPVINRRSYPTFKSSFFKHEKSVFIPAFAILSGINGLFFYLTS